MNTLTLRVAPILYLRHAPGEVYWFYFCYEMPNLSTTDPSWIKSTTFSYYSRIAQKKSGTICPTTYADPYFFCLPMKPAYLSRIIFADERGVPSERN